MFSCIFYISDLYKTEKMFNRMISDSFSLRYVPDQYKTEKMYDKAAADDCLATLTFVSNWFVRNKIMIKKVFTASHAAENVLSFDEDFGNVAYNCNEWVFLI